MFSSSQRSCSKHSCAFAIEQVPDAAPALGDAHLHQMRCPEVCRIRDCLVNRPHAHSEVGDEIRSIIEYNLKHSLDSMYRDVG
jgi:hypothetical protein